METTDRPTFTAAGLPVLIGSVPLSSHQEALEWIFAATPEIPLWPQLPGNPCERMMSQFAEEIPCIMEEHDPEPCQRLWYTTSAPDFDNQLLAFYEDFLQAEADPNFLRHSRFQVSRERAQGLYLLAESLQAHPEIAAVKGQITGPFTLLTGIKDEQGKPGYFNEIIRDIVVKAVAMKAAWQIRLLAARTERPLLLFIDEPALAGLGSTAFLSVTTDEIQAILNEVAGAIHQAGGLAGIHVCANTDWSLLLASDIDILSFDAFGYFDRLGALRHEVNAFLDQGKILAWGLVPTSRQEEIFQETSQTLVARWLSQAKKLVTAERDLSAILRQALITPSCGTGSLPAPAARRVLELTRDTSLALRQQFFKNNLSS